MLMTNKRIFFEFQIEVELNLTNIYIAAKTCDSLSFLRKLTGN